MAEFLEFEFADGQSVRLRTFPVDGPDAVADPPPAQVPAQPDASADEQLPPGLGGSAPVGRRTERVVRQAAALSRDALHTALQPLVPLLQEVHDTVASVQDRPHEVTVDFGVQFGSDLSIGIVGSSAQASLTVSATWKLD
ncbi:CU044_2847 family protein [Kitasatospora sp. KL5]|uniref:CU044_2847 family protein n=1 Tax=Kitasatospora sp. KL5 TaxID=3425125 RepID=UPI003D6FC6BE